MKIPANETALVVIDMQAILFEPEPPEADEVVARINGLVARARDAGAPVVWVQHETATGDLVADTPGWQLHPALATAPSDLFVRKTMSDAFLRTDLHALLLQRDVPRLEAVGAHTKEWLKDQIIESINYAHANGIDRPEITGWKFPV